MLIVRSLRPDRVSFCVTTFIINNLGSQYVEPPVLDIQQVVDDSSTKTPLIFVLSPGVVSVIVIDIAVLVICVISGYHIMDCACSKEYILHQDL